MTSYLLFVTIAVVTLLSPGPGVLLTVTNSINYGIKVAIFGIAGLILGMFVIAVISASGIGLIITSHPQLFMLLKLLGAFYLIYLGLKSMMKKVTTPDSLTNQNKTQKNYSKKSLFLQGLFVSLLNPKTIVFFIALFPQFIDINKGIFNQFLLLSSTFCILGFLVHLIYAKFSTLFKVKLSDSKNFSRLNKVSGGIFLLLAGLLITQ